ncbi:excisionase family DNA-binding protein [Chryseobacterium sp. EO14]|uniref:excisionase family DNA-binding protein n=1 Tax=Chryseobacterium sp. EO14 TaxID=2950551 RepID=UPI00210BF38F|nr:excisionase family DNA-binding protein [Chryseobacterium sp. EO14]MCQ4139850.1 excisionase family DNA-binding protein [Chryseobacterium sp. EO14]
MQQNEKILKEIRKIKKDLSLIKDEIYRRNLYRKKYITIKEAVIVTGVSKSFIQKLVASKQIPHSKPNGKLVFIHRKDLEKFLSQNRVSSNDEVDYLVSNSIHNLKK